MREWQRGAHLPGAVEAVETAEDESSDGGGGGVAPAPPGRKQSALSASFLQQAAAEGAAVAAGTPPGCMLNLHGMDLSSDGRNMMGPWRHGPKASRRHGLKAPRPHFSIPKIVFSATPLRCG